MRAAIGAAAIASTAVAQLSETVSVGYVMIPFTAIGLRGRPVTNLRASDVSVVVDGKRVRSDMFERSQNAPVSFTILIDASGSMGLGGKLAKIRTAIEALVANAHRGDEFALWTFAESEPRELVAFTSTAAEITNALDRVQPFGKTAFFDALAAMPDRTRLGRNPTRAIILLSDGIDNASNLSRTEVAHRLETVAIPIYALAESGEQLDVLREVAELTGGRLQAIDDSSRIAAAIASIDADLRAQYLIGFAPTGHGEIQYRRISLKVSPRVRAVRVRAGYRGTEPPYAKGNG